MPTKARVPTYTRHISILVHLREKEIQVLEIVHFYITALFLY